MNRMSGYEMVFDLGQFFGRRTGYSNIQFFETLPAISRNDFGVKVFCNSYGNRGFTNGGWSSNNNDTFLGWHQVDKKNRIARYNCNRSKIFSTFAARFRGIAANVFARTLAFFTK